MDYNLLNIKNLCSKKNITFLELSRRIKKSEQGLYKSLKSDSINIKTLAEIADVLDVCISELIADSRYIESIKNLEKKELASVKITDANEYLANKLSEVSEENGKLKQIVKNYEDSTRGNYTMQDVPALRVAESEEKLKTQIDK